MSNVINEKYRCMRMMYNWSIANFYVRYGVELIYIFNMVYDIFVKVKLEVIRILIILNMFGSRRSSDVIRFIFCFNFVRRLFSYFDLMNFFIKVWVWFNSIIQGMVILIVNILIIFYRDEWFGYILSYVWKM